MQGVRSTMRDVKIRVRRATLSLSSAIYMASSTRVDIGANAESPNGVVP